MIAEQVMAKFIQNPDCRYPEILVEISESTDPETGAPNLLVTNRSGSIRFQIPKMNIDLGHYAGQIEGSNISLKARISKADFESFSN